MIFPRVCYISNGEPGWDILRWFLLDQPCDLIFNSADNRRPNWDKLPDYDLGLNFLGTHKVPPEHVDRPRLGWVNFHPAPLPEFAGRNVAYHAIMTGANEFGATIHYMNEEFDTGPIIEVIRFPIYPGDTAGDLWKKSVECLKGLFHKWIPKLLQGRVPAVSQPPGVTRYYSKILINDEVSLFDSGNDLGKQILALTFHPKHHAKIVIGDRTYKIVPEDV